LRSVVANRSPKERIMVRSTLVFLVLVTLAAPAAAQVSPPPVYTSSAPVAAPPPVYTASGTAAAPSSSPYFAPVDRRGRTLIGTRTETRTDRGLWGAGLGLFLAGWVLDIAGTAIFNSVSNDRDGAAEEDAMAWSILPWVGPFIQLGIQAPHPALPLASALLQVGGTVLFVLGITSESQVEVPVYAWGDPDDAATARLGLDVSPTEGGAYATLTLHTM
jgi:hypothetical protein